MIVQAVTTTKQEDADAVTQSPYSVVDQLDNLKQLAFFCCTLQVAQQPAVIDLILHW